MPSLVPLFSYFSSIILGTKLFFCTVQTFSWLLLCMIVYKCKAVLRLCRGKWLIHVFHFIDITYYHPAAWWKIQSICCNSFVLQWGCSLFLPFQINDLWSYGALLFVYRCINPLWETVLHSFFKLLVKKFCLIKSFLKIFGRSTY